MLLNLAIVVVYFLTFTAALDFGHPKTYYQKGEAVDLLLNKVESDHTQLPYRYHDLPFVCHDKTKKARPPSLGQILRGDRYWESNYKLRFGEDVPCARLCDLIAAPKGMKWADSLVRKGYFAHWMLDGLPGATTFVSGQRRKYYAAGFPLGFVENGVSYYYNHVMLVIRYHREKNGLYTIVGFEVYPRSVIDETCPGSSRDYKNFAIALKDATGKPRKDKTVIPYTYAVYWREEPDVDYDHRWDTFYQNESSESSNNIHWLSLINSFALVLAVSVIVAVILARLLKSDIKDGPVIPTTDIPADHEAKHSWKSLSDIAVQSPVAVLLLSSLCAAGVQTVVAMIGVIVLLVMNFNLNWGTGDSTAFFENHQGAAFNISIIFILVSGCVSSYVGVILHKLLSNAHPNDTFPFTRVWPLGFIFASVLPLTVLAASLFINLFVWAKESSNALPFGTIVLLILLFFVIQVPLGITGAVFGNKFEFSKQSCFVNSYVSPKGRGHWKSPRGQLIIGPFVTTFIFGLVPFGISYVDLLFIFNSTWLEKTTLYRSYGFLLLTIVLLLVVISESAIVATYISLSILKNPNWQWLCFQVGSSIGWYIFGYSTYYFVRYLQMSDIVSVFIYFAYMAMVSAAIGVAGGAVGVIVGTIFIRKIYSAIKID